MKIVVLDGYTSNPGDLSCDELSSLGECAVFDRTEATDVLERAADAEIVLTNKVVLDREIIGQLSKLKYIGVLATGYNVVDIDAAREKGIVVTNIPAYSTSSVAQMTFALILELAMHVGNHSASVRRGEWAESIDFSYWKHPLVELDGLTMGIIGLGQIGKAVADIAKAFGMRVIANSRTSNYPGVQLVDLEVLLKQSDIVSIHTPLTAETMGLINKDRLSLMKPSAFIINTSRGSVVNEQDLADALNSGKIAGAGVDVLSTEPPSPNNPLLTAKNCFITPHIGWATKAARSRLLKIAVENVRAFLEGSPQNVVS